LIGAFSLMSMLGYPSQISPTHSTGWTVWAVLSTIVFGYILSVLVVEISRNLKNDSPKVRGHMTALRAIRLLSWGFSPIVYLLARSFHGGTEIVISQVGYSIADIVAKPVFTSFIFCLSLMKADEENGLRPLELEAEAA